MESDWKRIYSSPNIAEVILRKGLLEENDINCVVVDKRDTLYMIGEAEIYVQTEDVLIALKIINDPES
jgi:hypothetical protein